MDVGETMTREPTKIYFIDSDQLAVLDRVKSRLSQRLGLVKFVKEDTQ